ncbi:MAG: IS91 family transposase [Actinobacteria bacterium]|nr:IS91 family transposase [Actinomycetota bacterium]
MQTPISAVQTVPGKQRPEVAEVFRRYFVAYQDKHRLSLEQHRVARHIQQCRTAALGGHVETCDSCPHTRIAYNSCRDRHCPKCQAMAKEQWLSARQAELLPCGYFHLVFTLPHQLNPLVLHNRKLCLGLIFAAANQTLQRFAADPQWRLNGQLGCIGVLHTWSQTLIDHFHLHCLIPAGALSRDGQRWVRARKNYLFRLSSLAVCFRNRYLSRLQAMYDQNKLLVPEGWDQKQFKEVLAKTGSTKWLVYAKSPFAGPNQVLGYLARYTHRVAIANHRLQSLGNDQVSFSYKDRKNGNVSRSMTINAEEFIRRFLLHVLPRGFTKIRYFGFLAHTRKKFAIARIRRIIDPLMEPPAKAIKESIQETMLRVTGVDIAVCPVCGKGKMVVMARLSMLPLRPDTS